MTILSLPYFCFNVEEREPSLFIEPNSVEFEKLTINRPDAISVNAAICAQK